MEPTTTGDPGNKGVVRVTENTTNKTSFLHIMKFEFHELFQICNLSQLYFDIISEDNCTSSIMSLCY